jgi:hypothetical protein
MKKFWNGLREHKQLVFMVMRDWSLGMTNGEVGGSYHTSVLYQDFTRQFKSVFTRQFKSVQSNERHQSRSK